MYLPVYRTCVESETAVARWSTNWFFLFVGFNLLSFLDKRWSTWMLNRLCISLLVKTFTVNDENPKLWVAVEKLHWQKLCLLSQQINQPIFPCCYAISFHMLLVFFPLAINILTQFWLWVYSLTIHLLFYFVVVYLVIRGTCWCVTYIFADFH